MKTCNAIGNCKHKQELDVNEAGFPHCAYADFCDFQLPRDSRGKEVSPICPWGFSNLPCPAHGCVYCPFKDGAKK